MLSMHENDDNDVTADILMLSCCINYFLSQKVCTLNLLSLSGQTCLQYFNSRHKFFIAVLIIDAKTADKNWRRELFWCQNIILARKYTGQFPRDQIGGTKEATSGGASYQGLCTGYGDSGFCHSLGQGRVTEPKGVDNSQRKLISDLFTRWDHLEYCNKL